MTPRLRKSSHRLCATTLRPGPGNEALLIEPKAEEFVAAEEVRPNVVHVWAGHTQEAMDGGSHFSRTYEFDNGQMRRMNPH